MADKRKTYELAFAIGGKLDPSFKATHSEAASQIAALAKKSEAAMDLKKTEKAHSAALKNFNKAAGSMGSAWGNVANSIIGPLKQVAAVATVAGGAMYAVAVKTGQMGDTHAKTASKLGITTNEFGRLSYAADLAGVSQDTLTSNMKKMSEIMRKANMEGKQAVYVNGQQVMSLRNANGSIKDNKQILLEAADAMSKMKSHTDQATLASILFGSKAGLDMLPMLKAGRGEIEKMGAEAERLGITFDDVSGKNAEDFMDSITKLKASFQGIMVTIGKQLHEPLAKVNEVFSEWIASNREWIGLKVADAIQAFKAHIPAMKEFLLSAKDAVMSLVERIRNLIETLGGPEAALKKLAVAWVAFKALGITLALRKAVAATAQFTATIGPLIAKTAALITAKYNLAVANKAAAVSQGGFFAALKLTTAGMWKAVVASAALIGKMLILAAPIVAVVAAIAALGVAVYMLIKHWDKVSAAAVKFGHGVVAAFKGVVNFVKGFLLKELMAIKDAFGGGFVKGIATVFLRVQTLLVRMGNEAVKAVFGIDLMAIGAEWIGRFISGAASVWSGLKDVLGAAASWVGDVCHGAVIVFGETLTAVKNIFSDVISGIKAFFIGEFNAIKEAFAGGFFRGIAEIIMRIPDVILRMANDVIKTVTGIDLIGVGREWIKGFIDGILGGIKNAAGAVKDAVGSLIPKVGNLFSRTKDVAQNYVAAAQPAAAALPKFGNGGIATAPSIVAEDYQPELVIPLTKPHRAAELIKHVAPILPDKMDNAPSPLDNLRAAMSHTTNNTKNVSGAPLTFAPTINVNGGGDPAETKANVMDVLTRQFEELKRWVADRDYQTARVALA